MLKRLIHIIVVFVLLFQQLQIVMVCIAFKWEQPYLARTLCINRYDSRSICKGHCQLSKMVKEEGEREQGNKVVFKEQSEFTQWLESALVKKINLYREETNYRIGMKAKPVPGYKCEILQPPEFKKS